ncbi:MAG: hypothetical protein RBT78_03075 [Kiritimatiellia bacterium]|jgi:hypothetical protein|nr:hypothetical protein [Kiritimatiellia bacterium]
MKKAIGLAILVFAGCDYAVPLAENPDRPIDPALAGLWSHTDGKGETTRLLVLPLSKQEYLIVYPANHPEPLYFRACHCAAGDLSLIQLTWLGAGNGGTPEKTDRLYAYATYEARPDRLAWRMVNPEVIKPESVNTPQALRAALLANRQHPDLLKETSPSLSRVTPPAHQRAPLRRPPMPPGW